MIDQYNMEDMVAYKSESKKWLFSIVRQYIIDNKIRNWSENIPKYDEIDLYDIPSQYHYYSDIIERAFRKNEVAEELIDKADEMLERFTRVGHLRDLHQEGRTHYIITILQIKRVINFLW